MASKGKPAKPPITESKSRELVPVGPRHVSSRYQGKRTENGEKPTTARALVLRNGKFGSMGTGELVLANKISGREKLDLLGDDLLEKRVEMAKKALGPPFRLERCLRIAHAQFNAALDEINTLQDYECFYPEIVAEVQSRTPPRKSNPLQNPNYVASIVATRIHNSYMAAAAWKLVRDTLHNLDEEGLRDNTARSQIRRDERLKQLYLVLYDLVNELVNVYHAKFSIYVMAAPHYARYFKPVPNSDPDDPEMMFDWQELRTVYKSFLDSIIIELCLPQSRYPKQVLYSILHDAVDESPREAKRFPQAVWDAVGDLAMAVELQDIIEGPLLGLDSTQLKNTPRNMPEEYENWVDAQLFSDKAAKDLSIKSYVFPLERTKTKQGLEMLWKTINTNYKAVSGKDIDDLWDLTEDKQRTPQWHSFYMPSLREEDEISGGPSGSGVKGGKTSKKAPLAITAGPGDESDTSMPSLQSVSDSSEEESEDEYEYDTEDDEDDYETDDEDEEYDTEEEEQARDLLREAMDYALQDPDYLNPKSPHAEADLNVDDEVKGNPFIKLLGRLFSADPNIKTKTRTQPRKPFFGGQKPSPAFEDDEEVPPLEPIAPSARNGTTQAQPPRGRGVTVEEVQDEEHVSHEAKKKKKKPKKKKKKSAATAATDQTTESPVPVGSSPSANGPQSPTSVPRPSSVNTSSTYLPYMSTASLPTAQSARSYLQSEGLDSSKTKIKSRPDHASSFYKEKKGLLSRFGRRKKGEDEEDAEPVKKGSKHSWFVRLGKKSKDLMHQLLGTAEDEKKGQAPMKWEHFLKVMREMGFEYDPSTAGSSVRFDPPDPSDPPITFHKPHPDPTIHPVMLKEFAKKLKRTYGWTEEDFYKAL
ncbi:hypothetical protein GLOTRDRAFT_39174 [Gloeophyllum trabeum ATCC 11539]|uniref:Uncharacterized protein n=1 Tax=Gloeophyllum trabeum (strain ATCC 11539 / FP-39264 / Madison 617) TaxID=670483 RepID=S7QB68_GLOTA|nr:uncharacterized protein GLOTRDRAFT_39174 [Gloeophyllum trabeum ATCC 11539]EPQ57181.1 hypothetical protein GLOTRDRAFT_39174 [Gloeophyllum trabeum ATCC 11539]